MQGEQLRLAFRGMRKTRFYYFSDVPVKLPTLRSFEGVMQRLLEQRMFEAIRAAWRSAFAEKDLGARQLGQLGLERRFVHAHHGGEHLVLELSPKRGGK